MSQTLGNGSLCMRFLENTMNKSIFTRDEFTEWWDHHGLGAYDSPLWVAEEGLTEKPVVFVKHNSPVQANYLKSEFWEWCKENLKGTARCYSSCDVEEWWGLTNADDVALWLLRWYK